jgi:hypothetical protein
MTGRRMVVLIVVLASVLVIAGAPPSFARDVETSCQAEETVVLPTQIPQTFDCGTGWVNAACSLVEACLWTGKVRVEGAGIVGARMILSASEAPPFPRVVRCGFAINVCEATTQILVPPPCQDVYPESPCNRPGEPNVIGVDVECDWQGVVAVAVRITCELLGRVPLDTSLP